MSEPEPTPAETRKIWAEDTYAWFRAYCAAGFSDEQALAVTLASVGKTVLNVQSNSPELSELMSKMSVLADRSLSEE